MKKLTREGEKHLGASAIIITDTLPKKTLLLHHKKHNTWFQPGGHVEDIENPVEAVIREVKEETGIDISFLQEKIKKMDNASILPIPDFFLEEVIPAHGDEPSHFHLDFLYIITVPF